MEYTLMANCFQLLESAHKRAQSRLTRSFIANTDSAERIAAVVDCPGNRAGVRLIMACMLAKIQRTAVDVRKPYTKIKTPDAFSGRTYDEQFIAD